MHSPDQLLALARRGEHRARLRLADAPAYVSWPGGGGFQPCAILIDDRDLIDLVRDAERPHAAREIAERRRDDPELDLTVDQLAGDYLHLTRRELALPSRHLLGPSDDVPPGLRGRCRRPDPRQDHRPPVHLRDPRVLVLAGPHHRLR
ncbi:hypothetical protein [Nannocystis pusilla]|uniref:hypothetical protein n=1 Tax=Nannocystis pusilla TaxID=889268 RepID=UPI003DA4BCDA